MAKKLREEQNQLMTWSLVILAAFTIATSLYYMRAVIIPFVLSVFMASMISPLVDQQVVKWKFPRVLAVCLAMLVALAVVALFLLIFLVAVQAIAATITEYSEDISMMSDRVLGAIEGMGVDIDQETVNRELKSQIPLVTTQTIGKITGLLGHGALVLIFTAFLLTGRTVHVPTGGIYGEIDTKVRAYLVIKVVISAVTGILVWIILSLFGLKMAVVFGVLTFILNFIPSVGSIFATLLPIPVALAQFDSIWMIALVVICPGAVQILMGNVIEPKLQGTSMKLHPVVILLSLALWGLLWGIAGMVLAVPMTAILRIALLRFDTTKPIADLLAGELPSDSGDSQVIL